MKAVEQGKGDFEFKTADWCGYRVWIVADKPCVVIEIDADGVEHLIACGTVAKEWRLRGDSRVVKLSTNGRWTYHRHATDSEEIDNTPVEFTLPPPLSVADEMRRLIREELSQVAERQGLESFEEAMDFDVADEEEWRSAFEIQEMDEEFPNELEEPEGGDVSGGHGGSGSDNEAVPGAGDSSEPSGSVESGESPGRSDSATSQEVSKADS